MTVKQPDSTVTSHPIARNTNQLLETWNGQWLSGSDHRSFSRVTAKYPAKKALMKEVSVSHMAEERFELPPKEIWVSAYLKYRGSPDNATNGLMPIQFNLANIPQICPPCPFLPRYCPRYFTRTLVIGCGKLVWRWVTLDNFKLHSLTQSTISIFGYPSRCCTRSYLESLIRGLAPQSCLATSNARPSLTPLAGRHVRRKADLSRIYDNHMV